MDFSIIVPTFGRPVQLAACLRAIAQLDYPPEVFEVIVVDDGGGLAPEAVAPWDGQLQVTCVTQRHAGPAMARNTGAQRATGHYLVFTDDDCQPAPDWLKHFAATFAVSPDHALGGHTVNAVPDNPCAAASQVLVDYLYAYYQAAYGSTGFFTSNNFAVPAAQFRTLGGFDCTFRRAAGEDRDFCDRWRHASFRLTYVPEAVVYHAHGMGGGGYWRQHFNYGRAAWHFHQHRARRGQQPLRLEPLAFYRNLLYFPWQQADVQRKTLLTALLVVSQLANAGGFFYESAHHWLRTWQRGRTATHGSSLEKGIERLDPSESPRL